MAHLIAAAIAITWIFCSTPYEAAAQYDLGVDAIGLGVGTTATVTPTGVPAGTTATPTPTPTEVPQLPTATATFFNLIDQGGCAITANSSSPSAWWLALLPAVGAVRFYARGRRPRSRPRRRRARAARRRRGRG